MAANFQIDGSAIPVEVGNQSTEKEFTRNSGIFRWSDKKDKLLLREVRQEQPYIERTGSKEAGQKWSEIAAALNTHADFAVMPRDQRSVRDRFNKLLTEFSAKRRKEENASGISPEEPTEVEQLLEEIQDIIKDIKANKLSNNEKSGNEREKALNIRDKAMHTWGKEKDDNQEDTTQESKPRRKRQRRSGGEALEYLKSRREGELEMRKEELALQKQQMEMEAKKMEADQKRQTQLQEQLLLQQQQSNAFVAALLATMKKS